MGWNNGKERAKFERRQAKLREQYRAVGMTDEQIQAMYDYDKSIHNSNRRKAIHTQRLDLCALDGEADDGQNPLIEKFADKLTVELDISEVSRFAWLEEIEDDGVVRIIKNLPMQDIELLTKIVVDKFTLTEIARMENITQQAVSKKFQKIKKIFQNRL